MLYLHIPFCKQACSYCNFHFSTNQKNRGAVAGAMVVELRARRHELPPGPVPSIYFGGGTPSLLTEEELTLFFDTFYALDLLRTNEQPAKQPPLRPERTGKLLTEITLEANPDDLTDEKLALLAVTPVNRLSIGIQSFHEADLRFMNRAHNASEALLAVDRAHNAGFTDISIDLIYGGQTTTDAIWQRNLQIATDLGVNHISSYALTVEPKTALAHQVATGTVPDTSDERFARQFDLMVDHLIRHGYVHYEISNFARPGHESRHNSGYWQGLPYLGIGPGAHSFNGSDRRRWNVANNARYVKAGGLAYEEERLTQTEHYNEFVMTGLRRRVGIDPKEITTRFGSDFTRHLKAALAKFPDHVLAEAGRYRLSPTGIRIADTIISEAFII